MEATNITGAPAGDAVFSLLSALSDPAEVKRRLKVLNAATAEHKLYVEAVAPVSEVLKFRDEAASSLAEAKAALDAAKSKAADLVGSAKVNAAALIEKAKAEAKAILTEASAKLSEANTQKESASGLAAQVAADMDRVQKESIDLAQRMAEASSVKDAAEASKAAYEMERAAIIAKHEQFIAGL
jgi:cell division septum initiation protein DivIVA